MSETYFLSEPNSNSSTNTTEDFILPKINIAYTVVEAFIALFAVIGNSLIVYVFNREKQLKKKTNYYLTSLAAADLLVGLFGIPFAILANVGLPTPLYACLFTLSTLLSICTISILSLVAVCLDRYWMIVFPSSRYSTTKNRRTPLTIIALCWVLGTLIGMLPMMGWHSGPLEHEYCSFKDIIDTNYLAFIFFSTTLTPAILLLFSYTHIYLVVRRQARLVHQMTITNHPRPRSADFGGDSTAHRREVKLTKNLIIIVVFFIICWVPIHLHNCIRAFCPTCDTVPLRAIETFIVISHLHSAINPLLYAYNLRDFRNALKSILPKCFGTNVSTNPANSSSL